MLNFIKIILFVLVNIGGYFMVPVLSNLAVMFDVFPRMPTAEMNQSFTTWLYGGGTWVWIAAAIASVAYFFAPKRSTRVLLIMAPLYVTFTYGVAVMVYFNYFAPVG